MKVHCQVIEQFAEKATGEDFPYVLFWKCRDLAIGATRRSVFLYRLTADEEMRFGGTAVRKFVELTIKDFRDLSWPKRGLVRMKGSVSKFGYDHSATPRAMYNEPELLEASPQAKVESGGADRGPWRGRTR